MIYSELKTQLLQVSHRPDLTGQLYNFTQAATERINRRLGLELVPLVDPDDTNEILTDWPLLYLYAGLASLYEYINEGNNVGHYNQRWLEEIDAQNITSTAATTSPVQIGV